MDGRGSRFDGELDGLVHRLEELERRLRLLEARPVQSFAPAFPAEQSAAQATAPSTLPRFSPLLIASYSGRTSLVLGGGYLLRALTDSGALPLPFGFALALVYAAVWIGCADRIGLRRPTSAAFHALAGAAVAFPLLFEVTFKFKLLDYNSAAFLLTMVTGIGIVVACRVRQESIVWIFSVAAIIAALAFVKVGREPGPFALHLVLLATMTYWAGHAREWPRVQRVPALVADVVVCWAVARTVPVRDHTHVSVIVAAALTLAGTSIGNVAVKILALNREPTGFDIIQSAIGFAVGWGGVGYVAHAAGLDGGALGASAVLAGALAYYIAFARVSTRMPARNFHYFSTLGLAFVITGGILIFRADAATLLWVALALAGVESGRRFARVTLSAHGAAYLVCAAAASGLLQHARAGLIGGAIQQQGAVPPLVLVTLGAALVCSTLAPVGVRMFGKVRFVATIAGRRRYAGVPRTVMLAVATLGVAGLAVTRVVPWLTNVLGTGAHAGLLAATRTTTLAIAAFLMAGMARSPRVLEARWLVYPLLIACGVKVLFEDIRLSEPRLLAVALAVYGAALILAPRLMTCEWRVAPDTSTNSGT
jgi:hypothetical protein